MNTEENIETAPYSIVRLLAKKYIHTQISLPSKNGVAILVLLLQKLFRNKIYGNTKIIVDTGFLYRRTNINENQLDRAIDSLSKVNVFKRFGLDLYSSTKAFDIKIIPSFCSNRSSVSFGSNIEIENHKNFHRAINTKKLLYVLSNSTENAYITCNILSNAVEILEKLSHEDMKKYDIEKYKTNIPDIMKPCISLDNIDTKRTLKLVNEKHFKSANKSLDVYKNSFIDKDLRSLIRTKMIKIKPEIVGFICRSALEVDSLQRRY